MEIQFNFLLRGIRTSLWPDHNRWNQSKLLTERNCYAWIGGPATNHCRCFNQVKLNTHFAYHDNWFRHVFWYIAVGDLHLYQTRCTHLVGRDGDRGLVLDLWCSLVLLHIHAGQVINRRDISTRTFWAMDALRCHSNDNQLWYLCWSNNCQT